LNETLEIFTDGACKGNPGEAGIGIVIKREGKTIQTVSKAIGEATNNIAEYSALVYALQKAVVCKAKHVKVFTDSELMHRQVTGAYKIKNEKLRFLNDQVQHLIQSFEHVDFQHVRREKNKEADKLATSAIKHKQAKVVAPVFENSGEESPSSTG
jgi:ribonuclease HI